MIANRIRVQYRFREYCLLLKNDTFTLSNTQGIDEDGQLKITVYMQDGVEFKSGDVLCIDTELLPLDCWIERAV